MMTDTLKPSFLAYCRAHNLRPTCDVRPGCAHILKRKGVFILEVLLVSNCKYVPGSVGYYYPLVGASEAEMKSFLDSAHLTSPKESFKVRNGSFVKIA